jgi:glutaredoxin
MNVLKNIKKIKVEHILLGIIVVVLSCQLCKYMSSERFTEIDVDHDDIEFYGRKSCPYCVKQQKILEEVPDLNTKIKYIDTETTDGSEKFATIDGKGVPHFECKSTGKSSTGYKQVTELLSSLGLS